MCMCNIIVICTHHHLNFVTKQDSFIWQSLCSEIFLKLKFTSLFIYVFHWVVYFIEPEKPTVKSNFNESQNEPISKEILLQCNFTGHPDPIISWYKVWFLIYKLD